jgi:hypothetical protein
MMMRMRLWSGLRPRPKIAFKIYYASIIHEERELPIVPPCSMSASLVVFFHAFIKLEIGWWNLRAFTLKRGENLFFKIIAKINLRNNLLMNGI